MYFFVPVARSSKVQTLAIGWKGKRCIEDRGREGGSCAKGAAAKGGVRYSGQNGHKCAQKGATGPIINKGEGREKAQKAAHRHPLRKLR